MTQDEVFTFLELSFPWMLNIEYFISLLLCKAGLKEITWMKVSIAKSGV